MHLFAILAITLTLLAPAARADAVLLMAEEDGCLWCERWNEEIADIYPKTDEGQKAPLQRYDLHGGKLADVTFATRVHYTPTFILVSDGKKVDRIEGYPGEDFFWGLLSELIAKIE